MNIGILIENKDLFLSGILQQSLFIYQILQSCNFNVNFYSTDKEYLYFGQPYMKNIKVKITKNETLKDLNILIYLSSFLNQEDTVMLKNMGIKIVQLLCGNNYMINQEKIIFGAHKNAHSFNNSYIDEYWLLPMYTHSKSYIETHSKKPVRIMPYIWNSTFLDLWMQNNKKDINYEVGSSINILICEPNVNISKTSLVPLIITEKCVDIIDKIFCLCLKSKEENLYNIFGNYLDIIKTNKLELYNRMKLYDVLFTLKSINKCPFIISHQMLNDLNFLHLELFYLGYPVIHNCERMKSCGYFYNDHNIDEGSCSLYKAVESHINNYNSIEYKKCVKDLLFKFSPYNQDNKREYLTSIFELYGKIKLPLKVKEEIPKYVYVYKNKDNYSNFFSVNKNYKLVEYNDDKINLFFLKEYSQLYLDIYEFIEDYDVKMNFFYLCVIYRFGGLYINPDFKCLKGLDTCIESNDDMLICISDNSFDLSIMLCRKGLKIIYLTILKYIYLFKSKIKYCRTNWILSNVFQLTYKLKINQHSFIKDDISYKILVNKHDVYMYKDDKIFELNKSIKIYNKDNIYIPKIVFQTKLKNSKNNTKIVDDLMKRYFEGWEILNFDSDEKCIEYFSNNKLKDYPNIIEKFNLLKGAHKSDIFRYYYLYINGGCYMDDDAIINTHISNIIKEYSSVYIESNFFQTFKHIFNGFICVRPKDDIIKKALNHIYSIDYSKVTNYQIFCKELYNIVQLNIQHNTKIYKETIYKSDNNSESVIKDENQNKILTHYFQTKII